VRPGALHVYLGAAPGVGKTYAMLVEGRRLGDAGVDVEDLALRRPTLDDVFLTLTGHAPEERAAEEDADREAVA